MINKIVKELEAKQFEEPYVAGIAYALGVIARLTEPIPDSFDLFWKEYPRKVEKKRTKLIWKGLKVNTELFERIMVSLREHKYSKQWTQNGGQFIPYPATWLGGERWDDEVELPGGEDNSRFNDL